MTANLQKTRPLHYEGLDCGLWGPWLLDLAMDIAAEVVFTYTLGLGVIVEGEGVTNETQRFTEAL